MIEYCKGRPEEFEDIIDFINMVFSMDGSPHDFSALLPKLYSSNQNTANIHYLAKENGKIKAVVCVQPITLRFQEQLISCATVGSVSVHPNSRGKGYMKILMGLAVEDMKKEQITMSILSGKRHRYQHFGYELSGHSLEYHFNRDNFKHTKSMFSLMPLTLSEVSSIDTELILEVYKIFQQQNIHAIRPIELFYDISTSGYNKLYAIRNAATEVVGYLSAHDDSVKEIVLIENRDLYSALNAYITMFNCENISLTIAPYEVDKITAVASLYEKWSVSDDGNYRIFDLKRTLLFFLSIKNSYQPLTDGELIMEIKNLCNVKIVVVNNQVTVEDCTEIADYSFTEFEAATSLFSAINYYNKEQKIIPVKNNWFPLPLFIASLDKC